MPGNRKKEVGGIRTPVICVFGVHGVTDEYHEVEFEHVFDQIVQIDDTWAAMIKEDRKSVV